MTKRPRLPGEYIVSQIEAARPLAKIIGIFNKEVKESFAEAERQLDSVKQIMRDLEVFSNVYSPLGWAIYDRISTEIVSTVVNLPISSGEEKLSEYHLSESNLNFLRHCFKKQDYVHWLDLYDRSVERAKAGDFISSIPVVLMIVDGIFLHATGKHPFSGGAEAPVFDSQASRPGGLPEVLAIIGSTRRKLSTDPISTPFRHGILHGLNPNYSNTITAAKTFNLLQASIDYIDRRRDEATRLQKAESEQAPQNLREILYSIRKNSDTKKRLDAWHPREEIKEENIASFNSDRMLEPGSPEKAAADYLSFVISKNFGKVAQLTVDFPNRPIAYRAGRIRDQLREISVNKWTITRVEDLSPAMSLITVKLQGRHSGNEWSGLHHLRLMFADTNFEPLVRGEEDGIWVVMPDFLTGLWGVVLTTQKPDA